MNNTEILVVSFSQRDDVYMNIKNAKYSTYIGVAILAVVLVVSPIIIFLVRNATNTIQVSIMIPFHQNASHAQLIAIINTYPNKKT